MTLRIEQDAHKEGSQRWRWGVWLGGADAELDEVDQVTWLLHPTFPNPKQVSREREARFRIDAVGWGEFTIRARLHMRDGSIQFLEHELQLLDNPPRKNPVVFVTHSAADAPAARALQRSLEENDIIVHDAADVLKPGSFWGEDLRDAVSGSDAVIALLSGTESPWVGREVEVAQSLGVPVVPFRLDFGAQLPSSLEGVKVIEADATRSSAEHLRGSIGELSVSLRELFARKTRS